MKSLIDYIITQYLRIRWEKIQSTAAFVTLFGLGLIGANFWDLAWQLVFEPAGFKRNGMVPAIMGVILVVLGLVTLIIDRFSAKMISPIFAQDKLIFNEAIRIFEWEEIDAFLNDLSAKYFRKKHSSQLRELNQFLSDTRHEFHNKELKSAAEDVLIAVDGLLSHLAINFTGPNRPGSEIIDWKYNKHAQYGDSDWKQYLEKSKQLDKLYKAFEKACQNFYRTGNSYGLVEIY